MATKKQLNLALQGGGAHGAYTWGVLDRLLEEEDIELAGISGTSAGAMNGAVLVDGYMKNGRHGAKESLRNFWQQVSAYSNIFSPIRQSPLEQWQNGWSLDDSPSYNFFDVLSRLFSPYELNPLNFNPLRQVLEQSIDVKNLQACSLIRLFVTATEVQSGQARIFTCDEITVDVLLASACLPFLFQAVEIGNSAYWDGGYVGNPSIWPLIYNTQCKDIMLVQINPLERKGTPKRAIDIINRLNEISFNASLVAEMRAINFVSKLVTTGDLKNERYQNYHMHRIELPDVLNDLTASSKLNADWNFFQFLHTLGYEGMTKWLKKNKADIGARSSFDVATEFLQKQRPVKGAKSAKA